MLGLNKVLKALTRKPFAVIGHRCAAGEALENTLSALERALEAGVDIVEVDVQVTKDGVPILLHDESLTRIAGIDINVRSSTWSEIQRVTLPDGERLATLTEFLEAIRGRIPALIEIKHVEDTRIVVDHLTGLEEWIAIISFHDEALRLAKRLNPKLVTGLIYARPPGRILDAKRVGASIVLPRYNLATEKAVNFAHRLGLRVIAWTVNDEMTAITLYKRGVEGIATDYPSKLTRLREKLGSNDEHDSL
ncbi:glycerophosphodiester phosphodiesterase [Pyrolobus fumarii]|uniref:glycerophosphodiester phosphodiesterase n=1 Tax=Pyrolobus fumarii TaxID=54252 RepID=UPI003CC6FFEC